MNGTETRLPSRDPQIDGRRRLTVAHRWSSPPHLPRPVVSDPYRRMMWSLTSSGGRARWRVPQEARTGIVIHIWSRIAAESRISDTGQAALRTEATGEFCAGSVSSVRTDPNENGGREGATGNAWANPATSETPRRLVLEGGFAVHGGRDWLLRDGARALGFRDLRGCLQARCDGGYSIPRIATELGVRDWHVQAAGPAGHPTVTTKRGLGAGSVMTQEPVQRRLARNCRSTLAASSSPISCDAERSVAAGTESSGAARAGACRPKPEPRSAWVLRPRSLTRPSTIWSVGPRPAARATSLSAGTTSAASRNMPAMRSARSAASTMWPSMSPSSSAQTLTVRLRRTARPARGCRRLAPVTATPSGSLVA